MSWLCLDSTVPTVYQEYQFAEGMRETHETLFPCVYMPSPCTSHNNLSRIMLCSGQSRTIMMVRHRLQSSTVPLIGAVLLLWTHPTWSQLDGHRLRGGVAQMEAEMAAAAKAKNGTHHLAVGTPFLAVNISFGTGTSQYTQNMTYRAPQVCKQKL